MGEAAEARISDGGDVSCLGIELFARLSSAVDSVDVARSLALLCR